MIIQNKRLEKICCFYVSDFHLEMILIPYIKQIQEGEVTILTERKLQETVEILISKMNLREEEKQKILRLNWNGESNIKKDANIIIIGSEKYIKNKNKEIENKNPRSVLDCYSFEEIQEKMNKLIEGYEKTLNTLGKNNF